VNAQRSTIIASKGSEMRSEAAVTRTIDITFEVVVPVSDVDRAKRFYSV